MRVAVVQMDVTTGNIPANRAAVARHVEEVMGRPHPPDVIVLPELWAGGYALRRAGELASPGGCADAAFLGELARRHGVAFAGGSVLSLENGGFYNRAQVVAADGTCVGGYNKVHLFRPMGEGNYLSPGRAGFLFDLGGLRCACAICYDIRFCEFVRTLALRGAEVLFVAAQWPAARREHWDILLRARAIENQMYVVACNRCGVSGNTPFAGHSAIIAPDGALLAQAGDGETILTADLDAALPRAVRAGLPVFADRVPELYDMTVTASKYV